MAENFVKGFWRLKLFRDTFSQARWTLIYFICHLCRFAVLGIGFATLVIALTIVGSRSILSLKCLKRVWTIHSLVPSVLSIYLSVHFGYLDCDFGATLRFATLMWYWQEDHCVWPKLHSWDQGSPHRYFSCQPVDTSQLFAPNLLVWPSWRAWRLRVYAREACLLDCRDRCIPAINF